MTRLAIAMSKTGLAFGLLIAYFGLVVVFIVLFTLNANVVKKETLKQAAIARCLNSRPLLLKLNRRIDGLNLPVPTVEECKNRD